MINLVDKGAAGDLKLGWLSSLGACSEQLAKLEAMINSLKATEGDDSNLTFLGRAWADAEKLLNLAAYLTIEINEHDELFQDANGDFRRPFNFLLQRNALRNKIRSLEQNLFRLRFSVNQFVQNHHA